MSNRRSRCGRPGRQATAESQLRVLEKLRAASSGGKGIRFLSRDEIDVVLAMCERARGKKGSGREHPIPNIAPTAPRASRRASAQRQTPNGPHGAADVSPAGRNKLPMKGRRPDAGAAPGSAPAKSEGDDMSAGENAGASGENVEPNENVGPNGNANDNHTGNEEITPS